MSKFTLLALIAVMSLSVSLNAQTSVTKEKSTPIEAAVVYEQLVKEGHGTSKMFQKIANSYYFKNDHTNAKRWYEILFEAEKPTDKTLLFRYTQSLKALDLDLTTNKYLSPRLAAKNKKN